MGLSLFGLGHAARALAASADPQQRELRDKLLRLLAKLPTEPELRIPQLKEILSILPRLEPWPLTEFSPDEFRGIVLTMLGEAYSRRVQGAALDNIRQAVATLNEALGAYGARRSNWWALAELYLGKCQWSLGDSAAAFEDSIEAYDHALTVYSHDTHPKEWMLAQAGLACAYIERELGSKADNIEVAKRAIEGALTIADTNYFPAENAFCLFAQGQMYNSRIAGDRADNGERAIAAFEEAVSRLRDLNDEESLAQAHIGLGIAWANRIRGPREDNLERAIATLEQAANPSGVDLPPRLVARGKMFLAEALTVRVRGDRAENLDRAITAYDVALKVFTSDTFPTVWASIQHNLGDAYVSREIGSRSINIESAIACYEASLTVRTRSRLPQEWAETQASIGAAYRIRIVGDRSENQEMAIAALARCQDIYTRDATPNEWARAQRQLARTLIERIAGSTAENLKRAAQACESALEVTTIAADTREYLGTAGLLGHVYLRQRRWDEASDMLAEAHRAFLLLFGQGIQGDEGRLLIHQAGTLFADASFAALELGKKHLALVLASEGRARMLDIAMQARLDGFSPGERADVAALGHEITEWELRLKAADASQVEAAIDRLADLRARRGAIIAAVLDRAPAVDSVEDLATILAEGGAVVTPVITVIGGKLLIAARQGQSITLETVELPDLTEDVVARFLGIDADHDDGFGWLKAYKRNDVMAEVSEKIQSLDFLESFGLSIAAELLQKTAQFILSEREWRGAIVALGPQLWSLFAGSLSSALARLSVQPGQRLIWLPSEALGIVPLGLATDPATGERLGERYEVVHAESLASLKKASDRAAMDETPSLAVVGYTQDGNTRLPFAQMEGDIVASKFAGRPIVNLDRPGANSVLSVLPRANYWHFACHGRFEPTNARQSALIFSNEKLTVDQLVVASEDGRLAGPRLVFLSACETGLYDVDYNPNEFTGLPGAFISLGAAGVIATLWPIADHATMLLVAKFYDLHLGSGMRPSAALRAAQRWLRTASKTDLLTFATGATRVGSHSSNIVKQLSDTIDSEEYKFGDTPLAHPYYWGGFIYVGI